MRVAGIPRRQALAGRDGPSLDRARANIPGTLSASDTTAQPNAHSAVTVIEPPRGLALPDLRAVWQYRDLLYFLIRRDIAVVYKQTAFGFAWAVLRPLVVAGMYAAIFGLLDPPSQGVPYPTFVICGFVLWLFFSTSVTKASMSTVASAGLVTKVYFPRLTIPLAAVIPPLVDFAIAFVVLEVVLLAYGIGPQPELVFLPLVLAVLLAVATGVGLVLSAVAIRFRDVEVAIPFMLQLLLFASAVLFPLSILPEDLRPLMSLNPLVGVMETFRAVMLPVGGLNLLDLLPSVAMSAVLIGGGLLYFARAERTIADVI